MSSVVLELQQEALDKKIPVTDLLRKAYVVARKLKIPEFEKWVSNELSRYNDSNETPEYRQIRGSIQAWNPYHGWQPVLFDEHSTEDVLSRRPIGQAIAEIESLLERGSGTLHMPFSSKIEQQLRKSIGFTTQITLIVPGTILVKIVDAVRTIILNWSLKLEEDGILGDGLTFTSSERQAASNTSHNINNFYGPVHGPQIQQDVSDSVQVSTFNQIDLEGLKTYLTAIQGKLNQLHLSLELKQELKAELETLRAQAASPKPKHSIIRESLSSIRTVLEGAGGGVATELILQLTKLLGLIGS